MRAIDLNCDMGESFGAWRMGNDAAIMPYVSSANIACGFHGGDPGTIRDTAKLAVDHGVAIGAHPSYPDLQGFGRRNMSLSPREIFDSVVYQVSAVRGICKAVGGMLHHVKPHGALYNFSAQDNESAAAIAEAVAAVDPGLFLYGLSGSFLVSEAEKLGLRTVSEVFADRTYQSDGTLTPRSRPDALIISEDQAAAQALEMVAEGTAGTTEGGKVRVRAETICIHGDGAHALEFARAIYDKLGGNDVEIKAP